MQLLVKQLINLIAYLTEIQKIQFYMESNKNDFKAISELNEQLENYFRIRSSRSFL